MHRLPAALLLLTLLLACQSPAPPPEPVEAETAPGVEDLCVPYDSTQLSAMDATAQVSFLTERMKACRAACEAAGTCATDMPAMAIDFYRRARAQAELGRHGEAVADYSRSLALDPSLVSAYAERAGSLLQLERYADALADADSAVALSPQDPDLRALRCQILLKMEKPASPTVECQKALVPD
jgi:tetratricopeptide (TPR) repeat protein